MDEPSNSGELFAKSGKESTSEAPVPSCVSPSHSDDSDPDASDAAPSLDIETVPELEVKDSPPKSSPQSPKDRLGPPALSPKTSLSPMPHRSFPTRRLSPSRLPFSHRRRLALHKMRRPRRVMEDFVMYSAQNATGARAVSSGPGGGAASIATSSPRRLNDDSLCQLAASMTAAAKLKRKVVSAAAEPTKQLDDSPAALSKLTLSLDLEAPPRRHDCAPAAPRKRALSAEMVQTLDRLADILLTECRTSATPGAKEAERSTDATDAPRCWGPVLPSAPQSSTAAAARPSVLRSPVLRSLSTDPPTPEQKDGQSQKQSEQQQPQQKQQEQKETPSGPPVARKRKRKWRRTYDPVAAAAKRRRNRKMAQDRQAANDRKGETARAEADEEEGAAAAAASAVVAVAEGPGVRPQEAPSFPGDLLPSANRSPRSSSTASTSGAEEDLRSGEGSEAAPRKDAAAEEQSPQEEDNDVAAAEEARRETATIPMEQQPLKKRRPKGVVVAAAAAAAAAVTSDAPNRRKRRRRRLTFTSPSRRSRPSVRKKAEKLPEVEEEAEEEEEVEEEEEDEEVIRLQLPEMPPKEVVEEPSPPGLSPSPLPEPAPKRKRGRPPKRPPPPLTPMTPAGAAPPSSVPHAPPPSSPPAPPPAPSLEEVPSDAASSPGVEVPLKKKARPKLGKGAKQRARRKGEKGAPKSSGQSSAPSSPPKKNSPAVSALSPSSQRASQVTAPSQSLVASAMSPRPASVSAKELFVQEMASLEVPTGWRRMAESLIKNLRRFHTQATADSEASFGAVLITLPDPSRYPEYYYAVLEPHSLTTVEKSLRPSCKSALTSLWEFDYCVLRTLANARWYAGAGTPLGLLTDSMEQEYRRLKTENCPSSWSEAEAKRWSDSSLSALDADPRSSPYRGATREAELLRCICGNPLDDIDFGCVQCDQCYAWQHVYCVLQQQQQHHKLQQQQQEQRKKEEEKKEEDGKAEERKDEKKEEKEVEKGAEEEVKKESRKEDEEEEEEKEKAEKMPLISKSEPVPQPSTPESYVCEVCRPRPLRRELSCMMLKKDAHADCQYFYTLVWAGRMYRLGEFVYVPKEEDNKYFDVVCIDRLWINEQGEKRLYGHFYLRPYETRHESTRRFYPNELLRWSCCQEYPLSVVLGKCVVLDPRVYFRGWRHRRFEEPDHFVCEYRVNQARTTFSKIRDEWALVAGNVALSETLTSGALVTGIGGGGGGVAVSGGGIGGSGIGGSQMPGGGAMAGAPSGASAVWGARRIPHFFMERRFSPDGPGASPKREFTAEGIQSNDLWNATTARLRCGPPLPPKVPEKRKNKLSRRLKMSPARKPVAKAVSKAVAKAVAKPVAKAPPPPPPPPLPQQQQQQQPQPEAPAKRGRGRPRKTPAPPAAPPEPTAEPQPPSPPPEPEPPAKAPPKRRRPTGRPRGRPRKNSALEEVRKRKAALPEPSEPPAKTACPADSTAEGRQGVRPRQRAVRRSPASSSSEATRAVEALTSAPAQLLAVTWSEERRELVDGEESDSVDSSGDLLCENFVARLEEAEVEEDEEEEQQQEAEVKEEEEEEEEKEEKEEKEEEVAVAKDEAVARYYAHVKAVRSGEPAFVEVGVIEASAGDESASQDEEEEDEEEEAEEEEEEGSLERRLYLSRWEVPMVLRKSFKDEAGKCLRLLEDAPVVSSLHDQTAAATAAKPSSEVFECDSSSSPPHQTAASSGKAAAGRHDSPLLPAGSVAVPRVTADSTTTDQRPVRALVEYSSSSEDEDFEERPPPATKDAAKVAPLLLLPDKAEEAPEVTAKTRGVEAR